MHSTTSSNLQHIKEQVSTMVLQVQVYVQFMFLCQQQKTTHFSTVDFFFFFFCEVVDLC